MTTRQRRHLLLGVTVTLGALALFPEYHDGNHHRRAWRLGVGISSPEDVANNLLLFVPFGIAGALAIGGTRARQAALVVGSAILLSFSIEMLQTVIPSRFPSLVDVAANTAGAAIGLVACVLWQSRRSVAVLACYLAFACLFSMLLEHSARLSGWDASYPLIVGNEATGDRPWSGRLWTVDIADRAASGAALRELVTGIERGAGNAFTSVMKGSALASYDLASDDPCRAKTGQVPTLAFANGKPCLATGSAAQIGRHGWLRTADAAEHLTRRISNSGQMTLVATFEAANSWQDGPARIVSLSANADRRNFTLGQRGADLIVRIRTPLSGLNGSDVELVARDAVLPGRRQTVATTYDGARLSIFVDGWHPRASIQLGPGLALASRLVPRGSLSMVAHRGRLELVYFAGIFAVLGVLTVLSPVPAVRRSVRAGRIIAAGASPFVLEFAITAVTGRGVDLARPAAGLVALILAGWVLPWALARLHTPGTAGLSLRQRYASRRREVRRFAKIGLAATLALTLAAGQASQTADVVEAPGRSGRSLFAAPDGSSTNDGSHRRPFDLATLLGKESPAQPGDTVWLLGGHYRGHFVGEVSGTADAPIVIRRMAGARVTLDAGSESDQPTLLIRGGHVWYWGFEVTNSDPHRFQQRAGNPTMRGTGIDVRAPGVRIINVTVHDQANGIGAWSSAEGAEISGSLVYFNGIEGTDRGHGHGIYAQNTGLAKRVVDNIIFANFGAGIHAYTEQGDLDNLHFDGNVSFNNGALSAVSAGMGFNLLLGGLRLAWHPVLRNNVTYVASPRGANTELGYRAGCREAIVEGNYFIGGDPLSLTNCDSAVVRSNTLYGRLSPSLEAAFPDNRYLRTRPLSNEVLVRPNRYERGRAHIVIFNWQGLDAVQVSAAGTHLRVGDRYEIRDAQNFYGRPVMTGRYFGGAIALPMNSQTIAQPIGAVPFPAVHTGSAFGVFVLVRAES